MNLYSINTGFFKLDGGAMFGVVPKSIWNKLNPSDENNMCSWAMRCLLVEINNKLILIDTGIGNKQSKKFFGFYDLHGDDNLEKSLNKLGFSKNDITDVVHTHLHFDHCGGTIEFNNEKNYFEPAFKNANLWVNSLHWNHSLNSNPREKASFLKENIEPMLQSGQLKFLDKEWYNFSEFNFLTVNGHTESMVLPMIEFNQKKILYMADLVPSANHLHLPYTMAYDIRPLQTMNEKQEILKMCYEQQYLLFFEHDKETECCDLIMNEKQQIIFNNKANLTHFI